MKDDIRKNGEGYSDPTAYAAIKNWKPPEEHSAWRLKRTILNMVDLAGFRIEGEIILKNKKSGEVYK